MPSILGREFHDKALRRHKYREAFEEKSRKIDQAVADLTLTEVMDTRGNAARSNAAVKRDIAFVDTLMHEIRTGQV